MPTTMDVEERATIKNQIDRRYGDSQLFGISDLRDDESVIYYQKPKIILLKYRDKVPLYFFIKNNITYADWFKNAVVNGFLDFEFTNCIVMRNGKRVDFEEISKEVIRDGVTEFHLF